MSRIILVALLCAGPWRGWGREVPLTILHTTDMHGHVLPSYDYDGNRDVGGLLRCATLIKQLRARHENLLLVDCGDTIQGGAESYRSRGRIMIEAMEHLEYDAWVIGNHEFDWGLRILKELHDATSLAMYAANITVPPGVPNPLDKVKPFTFKDIGGVRVALVGLTTPGIPRWSRPYLLGPLLFRGSLETLHEVLPEVRAGQPDVVILLLHQGYSPYGDTFANEVKQIAEAYPEVDVIIGGHTHRIQEDIRINGILYTQAGYHANALGQVDLVFDTVTDRVISKTARVHEIGDNYEPDPDLTRQFEGIIKETRAFLDMLHTTTEVSLDPEAGKDGTSVHQELIVRALADATGADIILHGTLSDYTLPPGPVRERDIWRLVPYENRVGVVMLTAEEIEQILEENAGHYGKYFFMGVKGLCYDLYPENAVGDRVMNLRFPNGDKLHPKKRFKVAMNSYVMASGGNRFIELRKIVDRPTSRLSLTGVKTRDAVRNYLEKQNVLHLVPDSCVRVIEGD